MTMQDYERIYKMTDILCKSSQTGRENEHGYSSMRWNKIFEKLVAEQMAKEEQKRKEFLHKAETAQARGHARRVRWMQQGSEKGGRRSGRGKTLREGGGGGEGGRSGREFGNNERR